MSEYTPVLGTSIRSVLDAGRAVERIIERVSPLAVSSLLVLEEVAWLPGTIAAELSRTLCLKPQTIAGFVTSLTTTGHLRREKDPDDGRVVLLYVTPRGETLLATARAAIATIHEALTDAIEGGEIVDIDLNVMAYRLQVFTHSAWDAMPPTDTASVH